MTTSILTEADKAHVIDGVRRLWGSHSYFFEDMSKKAMAEAERGANDIGDRERAEWTARILGALTEEYFCVPRRGYWRSLNSSEVEAAFEKFLVEGLEDALSDYETHPQYYEAAPTAETHPLDLRTRIMCQRVLVLSPYRLWKFLSDVEDYTFDAVRENLASLTKGEGGEAIEKAAVRGFERAMEELKAELEASA